jgi:alpha-beta hydrolase superfamily lysophospholipase
MTFTLAMTLIFGSASGAPAGPQSLTLQAADRVSISALSYEARSPKAVVLLFHQAGSSKAEYATIAPRLAASGYSSLAIDQRSGGTLFGPNETVARLSTSASYAAAKADLVAALDWATQRHLPVILWGSSYSAALIFEVAADHAGQVNALLAFSPGEYLETPDEVAKAAAQVQIPIYVTSSSSADEVSAARMILSASPSRTKIQYEPKYGVHGSSTLMETRNPKGAAKNWVHVLSFLDALSLPPS